MKTKIHEEQKMKDTFRQVAVVLTVVATILINVLANALPINGLNTGQISDRFNVYFVPAGYVFIIWFVIYLGLISFAVFHALPAQRLNARMQTAGWWVSLSGLANIAWIFSWHYEQFSLSLVAMLALLFSLIASYLSLGVNQVGVSKGEKFAAHVPISIYLGWITVATVANATSLLDFLRWDRFGISPEIWMVLILGAVLIISLLMSTTRRDIAYACVILWALAGISVKHAATPAVSTPTWITFFLVAAGIAGALILSKSGKNGANAA